MIDLIRDDDSEVCSMEVCPAVVYPGERYLFEICSSKVCATEICMDELILDEHKVKDYLSKVCLFEIGFYLRIIPPPLIPRIYALFKYFEMFGIRHNPSASG